MFHVLFWSLPGIYTYIIIEKGELKLKLPEIFKNEIPEEMINSQTVFYGTKKEVLAADDFPYYAFIQTKSHNYKTKIIGKTTNYLVTASGMMIYLKDVINMRKM